MNRELKHKIASRANLAIEIGSIVSPRPWFPSRSERAELIAAHVPRWAIASGHTAGWVWSGMGHPEPWSLLRPIRPEISPLERTQWKARRISDARHGTVVIGGLRLLDPASCVREILLGDAAIDVCASQIALLTDLPRSSLMGRLRSGRTSKAEQEHALRVLDRVDYLRRRYPDITR